MFKSLKGQGTVEYIVLVTSVIALAIYFLLGSGGGSSPFQDHLNKSYDTLGLQMENVANRLVGN